MDGARRGMKMLVQSMYELAMIERDEQLRKAARRQQLLEYPGKRGSSFPTSSMAALASIRTGFALRQPLRFRRPAW